jgi:hypothetical protein
MEAKLQQFLDNAFAPYGDFPAKPEITKELLANLTEKYNDLKAQGKSDQEAYQATTESFGDVAEIMEQLPHTQAAKPTQTATESEHESSWVCRGLRQLVWLMPTWRSQAWWGKTLVIVHCRVPILAGQT